MNTIADPGESLRGTLVSDITDRLRHAILTGDIPPGSRLMMREIEARFDVSHIPIREALHRLEAEGLVQKRPRRQAIVAPISLDEVDQLYDLRRILEVTVAERAVPFITPEQLQIIESRLTLLDRLDAAEQTEAFLEAHREFHWAVLELGASPLIERVLRQLWQTSERYIRLAVNGLDTGAVGQSQHYAMYEALRGGDSSEVRARTSAHLQVTGSAIRSWYEQNYRA